jgi:hypothetical protein
LRGGQLPDDAPAFSRYSDTAKNPTNIANSFNRVKQIALLKYLKSVEWKLQVAFAGLFRVIWDAI